MRLFSNLVASLSVLFVVIASSSATSSPAPEQTPPVEAHGIA